MSSLQQLYLDSIRHHASEPVGFRQDIKATHRHETYNPLCGDRIELMLRLAGEEIQAAAFDGEACTICLASASMLCATLPGLTTQQGRQWHARLLRALGGEEVPDLGELAALLGVRAYPSRIRCATLPWSAAEQIMQGGANA